MDRAANSSWLHGLFTAAVQMCVHRTCVQGLSGGGASGSSGSASHGEAVKVPGGGLSGLSGESLHVPYCGHCWHGKGQ